ncbi:MAG: hypothetical protein IT299_12385 [Dehalococcoidia bacterium]|nr:hypothetical protein [Dehalococcoidia bacterium]
MNAAAGLRRTLPVLRPYQAEVARALLRLIVDGEGGSISVEIARQGGKNELSAQVELYTLLMHAARGGTAVKCAPTYMQAAISRERLRRRFGDAGLASLVRSEGGALRCGAASARMLSAEPGANVVGHTADLLLEVDEAQDVRVEKFDRDFRPMAASTNAPVAFYGTPWGASSLLEQAKATHRAQERAGGPRRHFRFDWEQVARYVPAYRAYVEGERARLGERHPLFRTQYLLEVVHEADRLFDAPTLAQVEGRHARLRAPLAGERYVAGLDLAGPDREAVRAERDWTVLTIGRATAKPGGPALEVVEFQAWHGEPTESLLELLADRLRSVWRVRHVAVDATGLGGPLADLLAARLPRGVVEPVVFTSERKSRLGFGLLAAAHSGRLRLFDADGSREWIECRRQLGLARGAYRDARTLQFDVDPTEGHDDYLLSLALCVAAARHEGGPRAAHGRFAQTEEVAA